MFLLNFMNEERNFTDIIGPLSASDIFYGESLSFTEIIIGTLLIFANTPILINILKHAVLRAKKEYLLIAG
jgi:hypothetical protein